MIEHWPWLLTPLTAQTLGGWFALPGVTALMMGLDGRWSAIRITLESQLIGLALILLGTARAWEDVDTSKPLASVFVAGIAVLFVALLALECAMLARRIEHADSTLETAHSVREPGTNSIRHEPTSTVARAGSKRRILVPGMLTFPQARERVRRPATDGAGGVRRHRAARQGLGADLDSASVRQRDGGGQGLRVTRTWTVALVAAESRDDHDQRRRHDESPDDEPEPHAGTLCRVCNSRAPGFLIGTHFLLLR